MFCQGTLDKFVLSRNLMGVDQRLRKECPRQRALTEKELCFWRAERRLMRPERPRIEHVGPVDLSEELNLIHLA